MLYRSCKLQQIELWRKILILIQRLQFTKIKIGAVSPLAGISKSALKSLLAAFQAQGLELFARMISICAISEAMVKPAEIRDVGR
jgi:hypothetical protein